MLSGYKPFIGDTMEELFANIVQKDIDFSLP